jgi:DNA-binding NtrC family response regulator
MIENKARILLVNDEEQVRGVLADALKLQGIQSLMLAIITLH